MKRILSIKFSRNYNNNYVICICLVNDIPEDYIPAPKYILDKLLTKELIIVKHGEWENEKTWFKVCTECDVTHQIYKGATYLTEDNIKEIISNTTSIDYDISDLIMKQELKISCEQNVIDFLQEQLRIRKNGLNDEIEYLETLNKCIKE